MPHSLPTRLLTARTARWSAAAAAALAAVAFRALLQPVLGDDLPFIIAAPVSLFCALMWGAGPGALATAICLAGALAPGIPPDVLGRDAGQKALLYVMAMTVACVLIARVDAMRRRSEPLAPANHTPLVRWLSAALFGAVLVPATAVILAGWWTYDRTAHATRETAVRRADLAYEHASHTFDVARRLVGEASTLAEGRDDVLRSYENDARQRLSDMLLGVPSVVNLNVWDAKAVPVVRSDRAIDPGATVGDRDYFRRQAAADLGYDVSEVLIGRQTGRELFNLTHRRPSADGSFRGVVAVSLNPEYFRDYYRAIVAQNTEVESISLVRTDGAILVRWPLPPAGTTRLPADAPSLLAVQAGQASGIVHGRLNTTGERRVGAFRRLAGLPVYVVVGFSEAAMLAGWVRTMGLICAIALPITVMLIAVTSIARRRVQSEQRAHQELQEQTRLRAATEKSALEAHRRETLATLTAGVAHDFNNLLAILSNGLHIQNKRHPGIAAEPQHATMRRAVQTGTRLTRQLLSFTRKQALKPEVIALQDWLPELEELVRTTLGSRIALSVTVAPDTPRVLVDAAELELAIVNMAVNAKHAQAEGGVFALAAEVRREAGVAWVAVSARDEGAGIPAEILHRVTEPFFTTKEAGSGSGLGLNQVRGVVDAAGGQLRIDSKVGRGTTLTLLLPPYQAEPAVADVPADTARPADAFKGHVLVAEDNDDVATVTTELIESLGLRVTRAANAAEALKVLRTPGVGDTIGFVLTDVVMPGAMDGAQLALELKAERPGLPVTVITGFAENLQSALYAGLDVMQKPLALEELEARLRVAFAAG